MNRKVVASGMELTGAQIRQISELARRGAEEREADEKRLGIWGRVIDVTELLACEFQKGPNEKQLRRTILGLSHKQRCELEAVMWLGRGDDRGSGALKRLLKHAHSFPENAHFQTQYICGKSPLHEYLDAGLKTLGF